VVTGGGRGGGGRKKEEWEEGGGKWKESGRSAGGVRGGCVAEGYMISERLSRNTSTCSTESFFAPKRECTQRSWLTWYLRRMLQKDTAGRE
jgi:hypothetical protein